jgi:eukaryotic-like serine/threonine-protein kinase
MIDPDRWQRVEALFQEALDQPPADRGRFLDRTCAEDTELRAELEQLLAGAAASATIDEAVARVAQSLLEQTLPEPEEPVAGRRFGAYRVVRELGRGGMGRVFLAERDDAQYSGRVAIKLLASGSAAGLEERFRTERQVQADLQHPGIARLIDAGVSPQGDSFLVMEFVDGEPIDAWCRRQHSTVEERLRLVIQLCRAVQHAHQNLVVHRDIKPSNVLVTADGAAKLLDFGIAKLIDPERARALDLYSTVDVTRVLTLGTASPEQLRGEPATTATDVYALGHLLYRLLAGRSPHAAAETDPAALSGAILGGEPPRPSLAVLRGNGEDRPGATSERDTAGNPAAFAAELRSTPQRLSRRLRGDLDTIILKALRKEPERRYAGAADLAEDLERHLDHRPVLARGDSLAYLTRRFLRRHRAAAAATAAAFAVLVGLVGFYTAELAIERDRAVVEARRAEEVSSFLTGLFEVPTPEQSLGEPISAREMLDLGAARIRFELDGEPAVQAALMRVIGSSYASLGQAAPAVELLEQALATRESLGGPPDPVLGDVLHALGRVYLSQGRFAEADTLLSRALDVRRAVRGPVHRDVADTLIALAAVQDERAAFQLADRHLDEAQQVAQQLDPAAPTVLADVLRSRASLDVTRGRYDEAIATYRDALALRLEATGADHPATLTLQTSLAGALNDAGRMAEAEVLHRELLAALRRILPEGHPSIANALATLSSSLKMQGRPQDAERYQLEALAVLRSSFPGDNPRIMTALNNLANLRHDLRDLDGAFELHQESLAMAQRLYGAEHPSLAHSYANLAALQIDRADYEDALDYALRAYALDRAGLGEDHPFIGHDLTTIGNALILLGRFAEAEQSLREALDHSRRTLPDGHPQTANAERDLAIVLARQHRCAEAAPHLRMALPVLEAAYPGNPWETALARVYLGSCLATLSERDEGEPLLRAGVMRLAELRGESDRLTREARALLEALHD